MTIPIQRPIQCRVRITLVAAMLFVAAGSRATLLLTQEQALATAFPGATFRRLPVFLTAQQLKRVRELGGREVETKVVYRYDAFEDGKRVGTAYFDKHRVRTLSEVLMLALDADGAVKDIRVLSFKEPQEYLPRRRWYEQFLGRSLKSEVRIGREINGITGATLTARATSRAARRMLAIHRVLSESDDR